MYLHVHMGYIHTYEYDGARMINRGIEMLKAWNFQQHVTGVLGVSQGTVARMWVRFQSHGNVRYRQGGSCERREDCFIDVQAQSQGFVKAAALQNDLQNANGIRISKQTIRKQA